ncbi:MAG: aminotransferase class IV [Alphaproteobacteria bacterium]|nr:aminotransferase class IV [Alphaproteobacteria bacterium]
MILWHNGVFKDEGAVFSAADRLRLGDGVFDTMLAVDGKPVFAAEHFERLGRHGEILGIKIPALSSSLVHDLLQKNALTKGRIAINTLVTRGPSARGLASPENPQTQIVMSVSPLPDSFPPIHAVIARTVRRNEGSPLSRIKSCNYGDNILALREAEAQGCNDAVMLNNAGYVAGMTTANIYIQQGDRLLTPPLADGALAGIIRQKLIAAGHAVEARISLEMLAQAMHITLSNSLRGLQAVVSLDGKDLMPKHLESLNNFHWR